jgi:hypothetical protein
LGRDAGAIERTPDGRFLAQVVQARYALSFERTQRPFKRLGPTDRDHRNALSREVAAPASSERLYRDPVALSLDKDDGLHHDLLNAVLLRELAPQDHHAIPRLAQSTLGPHGKLPRDTRPSKRGAANAFAGEQSACRHG